MAASASSLAFSSFNRARIDAPIVSSQRWTTRVVAYAFILVTDRYPPFQLAA